MKNSERQVKMSHPSSKTLRRKKLQDTLIPLKLSRPHQQRESSQALPNAFCCLSPIEQLLRYEKAEKTLSMHPKHLELRILP